MVQLFCHSIHRISMKIFMETGTDLNLILPALDHILTRSVQTKQTKIWYVNLGTFLPVKCLLRSSSFLHKG